MHKLLNKFCILHMKPSIVDPNYKSKYDHGNYLAHERIKSEEC